MAGWTAGAAIVFLLGGAVQLQVLREQFEPLPRPADGAVSYVRSPQMARRLSLSFDAVAADVYWMRAIQHYGATRRSTDAGKTYDRLYPLLDLTTSLDPYFRPAYRFGAIFLSEPFPGGAGRTDLAITLLEKGLAADPGRWEYAQDVGFVHYWWRRDYRAAADWFLRASQIPGAPEWLKPLAAVTLAQGGNSASSRRLWQEVSAQSDVEWLRTAALRHLSQLDALDRVVELAGLIAKYTKETGARPRSWNDLMAARYLDRVPFDPEGYEYLYDADRLVIGLHPESPLNPLPLELASPPDGGARP